MKIILKTVILSLYLIGEFSSQNLFAQGCQPYLPPSDEYQAKTHETKVDVGWYAEWTDRFGKKLPEALAPLEKWDHPYMKKKYASEMHEDSYASDVSNMPGPGPNGTKVQYFHSLQKGKGFSGMCPSFAFIDDTTIVTLSFGRANTTLLLLDVAEDIKILDTMAVPGRGSSALDLAKKSNRTPCLEILLAEPISICPITTEYTYPDPIIIS